MMSWGLNVPKPAIPIPALAVPNAAPTAKETVFVNLAERVEVSSHTAEYHLAKKRVNINGDLGYHVLTAEATPARPKKGANGGQDDMGERCESRSCAVLGRVPAVSRAPSLFGMSEILACHGAGQGWTRRQ